MRRKMTKHRKEKKIRKSGRQTKIWLSHIAHTHADLCTSIWSYIQCIYIYILHWYLQDIDTSKYIPYFIHLKWWFLWGDAPRYVYKSTFKTPKCLFISYRLQHPVGFLESLPDRPHAIFWEPICRWYHLWGETSRASWIFKVFEVEKRLKKTPLVPRCILVVLNNVQDCTLWTPSYKNITEICLDILAYDNQLWESCSTGFLSFWSA